MRKNPLTESFRDLIAEVINYLKIRGDLFRLALLENFSRLFSWMFSTFIGTFCIMFSILFASLAVAIWINRAIEDLAVAFIIIAGFYLALALITVLLRKYIMTRPFVRKLKKVLFADIINKESEDGTN